MWVRERQMASRAGTSANMEWNGNDEEKKKKSFELAASLVDN